MKKRKKELKLLAACAAGDLQDVNSCYVKGMLITNAQTKQATLHYMWHVRMVT